MDKLLRRLTLFDHELWKGYQHVPKTVQNPRSTVGPIMTGTRITYIFPVQLEQLHMQKQEDCNYLPGGGFTVTFALTLLSTGSGVPPPPPPTSTATKLMVISNVIGSVGGDCPGGAFRGSSEYTI